MRPALLVLGAISGVIAFWFRLYFTSAPLPSVDLPAHIALAELFIQHWERGYIQFYDPSSYTGWPALTFDGFLPYFVTGLLSRCFQSFSEAQVRLAAHVLLVAGAALFPISFYYAAKPLIPERARPNQMTVDTGVALSSALFASWFLNHDLQWYGIGAAAPMNIGLYPQLFGWHFLLLFCGALFRAANGDVGVSWVGGMALALLGLTHLQSFVFALFMLLFGLLFLASARRKIFWMGVSGTLAAGVFLAPCFTLLGEYTAFDVHRPKGDLVQMFVRYPLHNLALAIQTAWREGTPIAVDPLQILAPILFVIAVAVPKVRAQLSFAYLGLFILCAAMVLGSNFVASSLPFGFHYYRFVGYLFILGTLVAAAVYASVLGCLVTRLTQQIAGLATAAMLLSVAVLPHVERGRLFGRLEPSYLSDERAILQDLAASGARGRVYVEHLTDYKRFAPLSVHYIASRAFLDAGFETLANTFLQRSLAYRIFVVSAHLLRAKTYNVPLLFAERATLEPADALQQFREFGVTHIVAGTKRFKEQLSELGVALKRTIGSYNLYEVQPAPFRQVEPVQKIAVGYFDRQGSLPFRFVEYYFQMRKELHDRYELVELHDEHPPAAISLIIVNSREARPAAGLPLIRLQYVRSVRLDHYSPEIPKNLELSAYRDAENYLDTVAQLSTSLSAVLPMLSARGVLSVQPTFEWSAGEQSFSLRNLEAGQLYRINYSYFPYFSSSEGKLFRGSGERIFFIPNARSAVVSYSRWAHPSAWWGAAMTLVGSFALLWLRKARS